MLKFFLGKTEEKTSLRKAISFISIFGKMSCAKNVYLEIGIVNRGYVRERMCVILGIWKPTGKEKQTRLNVTNARNESDIEKFLPFVLYELCFGKKLI